MIAPAAMFVSLAVATSMYGVAPRNRWRLLVVILCAIAAWDGLLMAAVEHSLIPRVGFAWLAVLVAGASFILLGRADFHGLGGLVLRGVLGTALALGVVRALLSVLNLDPFAAEPPAIPEMAAASLLVVGASACVAAVVGHAMAGLRGAIELSVLFGGGVVLLSALLPGAPVAGTGPPVELVIPALSCVAGISVGAGLSIRRRAIGALLTAAAVLSIPALGYLVGVNLSGT